MPLSKKRKKEGRGKRRDRGGAPGAPVVPAQTAPAPGGSGLLTRMRGGLQNMAGTGAKKESLLSKIVTWALVIVVAYFVARRFGLVP